jgi:hypothetical protein
MDEYSELTESELQDIEEEFDTFWKHLIINEDGSINLENLKRELTDYSTFIGEASKVYAHVTNGNISKPNTSAEDVISVSDDENDKFYYNLFRDDVLYILDEESLSSEDKLKEIREYFKEERE